MDKNSELELQMTQKAVDAYKESETFKHDQIANQEMTASLNAFLRLCGVEDKSEYPFVRLGRFLIWTENTTGSGVPWLYVLDSMSGLKFVSLFHHEVEDEGVLVEFGKWLHNLPVVAAKGRASLINPG